MTVEFRAITKDNWFECTRLKVRDDQASFVATNVFSIAQAQFFPEVTAQAIYAGDEMVGFLMHGEDADENPNEYWVWRLMIDARYQGKGYGRAAMDTLITQLRANPTIDAVYLSYEPENHDAARFYARLGFEATGRIEHGELVVRLALNQT